MLTNAKTLVNTVWSIPKKHGYFGSLRQWLDLSNVFAGPHLTLMSKPSDPTQNTVFKWDPRDVWF